MSRSRGIPLILVLPLLFVSVISDMLLPHCLSMSCFCLFKAWEMMVTVTMIQSKTSFDFRMLNSCIKAFLTDYELYLKEKCNFTY